MPANLRFYSDRLLALESRPGGDGRRYKIVISGVQKNNGGGTFPPAVW
jgi:hypothetical protein